MVIADTIGVNVNEIFDAASYSSTSGISFIVGSLLFTFQIYCDFSGYSDIAIGTAKLLGFRLMRNFAYPFFSRNIGELWHRWHISLSTWFRDYVFIPMGGSRVTTIKYLRNIILTFAISGLWHGANWTFVIWGVLNGLYYIPMLFSKEKGKYTGIVASDSLFPNVKDFLKMILTFTLFSFSMIFFRSESLQDAGDYIYYLVSNFLFNTEVVLAWLTSSSVIMVFVLVIVEWFQRRKEYSLQIQDFPLLLRWAIYISAMAVFIYYGNFGSDQQFIYFQF